jgi:hypothetical protein
MTLEYLVANIDEFDEELVIFQKDELSLILRSFYLNETKTIQ